MLVMALLASLGVKSFVQVPWRPPRSALWSSTPHNLPPPPKTLPPPSRILSRETSLLGETLAYGLNKMTLDTYQSPDLVHFRNLNLTSLNTTMYDMPEVPFLEFRKRKIQQALIPIVKLLVVLFLRIVFVPFMVVAYRVDRVLARLLRPILRRRRG